MRAELEAHVTAISQVLVVLRRHLDWDQACARLEELNRKAEDSQLWDDPAQAQKVMKEREQLTVAIKRIVDLEKALEESLALINMGDEAQDAELLQEGEALLVDLSKRSERMRIESLLSGDADSNDCFLEIHAGAGGTEAQDWALILQRLYLRWAEKRGYKIEWIEEQSGEEAGIKSCTFKVMGHQAYGWLKTESGVHRLVRISPFDSNARRHTSFASVWVYPVVDDNIDVVVEEKDLRIDTYRASGAGGQHVNKTESAVRITHLPTNIVVQCQNDRSQHRNKAQAMSMLKARLYERELQTREEAAQAQNASKSDIGWGHQIRSYVLQPYQLVKDLRTNVEMGNTQAVLDGDIDIFIEAALTQRLG
jgi:peptide chain release factor 2